MDPEFSSVVVTCIGKKGEGYDELETVDKGRESIRAAVASKDDYAFKADEYFHYNWLNIHKCMLKIRLLQQVCHIITQSVTCFAKTTGNLPFEFFLMLSRIFRICVY